MRWTIYLYFSNDYLNVICIGTPCSYKVDNKPMCPLDQRVAMEDDPVEQRVFSSGRSQVFFATKIYFDLFFSFNNNEKALCLKLCLRWPASGCGVPRFERERHWHGLFRVGKIKNAKSSTDRLKN